MRRVDTRLPTAVSLDIVAETTIFCGYEKTFPRFRLRGIRLGFGLCRRLLLGKKSKEGSKTEDSTKQNFAEAR